MSNPNGFIDLSSSSDDDTIVPAQTTKSTRPRKQQLGRSAKSRRMASTSTPFIESEHETDELGDVEAADISSCPPYIISSTRVLSGAEEKMVVQKVQAIGSKFPIHVTVMSKSSIDGRNCCMYFTSEYARIYLPSTSQDLTLHLEGCLSREWKTRLHVQGAPGRYRCIKRITSGWPEFISDNRLALGDICLFELLTKTRGLRMNVHLIRKPGRHA